MRGSNIDCAAVGRVRWSLQSSVKTPGENEFQYSIIQGLYPERLNHDGQKERDKGWEEGAIPNEAAPLVRVHSHQEAHQKNPDGGLTFMFKECQIGCCKPQVLSTTIQLLALPTHLHIAARASSKSHTPTAV